MTKPPIATDLRIAQAMLEEAVECLTRDMADDFDTGLGIILAMHMADHIRLSLAAELDKARLETVGND